jgi:hypothetical protein
MYTRNGNVQEYEAIDHMNLYSSLSRQVPLHNYSEGFVPQYWDFLIERP